MNSLEQGCLGLHGVLPSLPRLIPTLISRLKGMTPLNISAKLVQLPFKFVDAGENLVMVDDVATPSNPPIALVEKEELEEAPLDVNVSQQSREKKPSRKMVSTRVDRSTWDH